MDSKIIITLAALVAVLVVGCSQQLRPDGFPPLYPATVLVIQDGQPLGGAMISLYRADDSPQKWGIFGITNSNGRAVLLTHGTHSGVPEGEYVVTVTKQEEVEISSRAESTVTESFTRVEEQYVDPKKSPLRIHIQKKGKNYEEIDVGKPVRISLGRDVA